MSTLYQLAMKSNLPPLPNQFPAKNQSKFAGLVPKRKRKDYSSVLWKEYFEEQKDVCIGDDKFRIYLCGKSGPVLLLLHGAGHSALSWAVFAKTITSMCDCQVVAMDFRGHGDSTTTDDMNMDATVMAKDVADVLGNHFDEVPPVVILGHSMGGAIAVHIGVANLIPSLRGLAVIDVVEGTAMDALPSMKTFLRGRPDQFKSLEGAIEWSIRAGQLRNLESAKVSMPGQLKRVQTNMCTTAVSELQPTFSMAEVAEEEEEQDGGRKSSESEDSVGDIFTWRVDLSKTEPHWEGWFKNMSSLFMSCAVPKLLILAGVDRLDKELTIGQMQGKFQMQVLAKCGHMVHEDVPDKVAEIITGFLLRQKLTQAKDTFQRHMPEC